jgi:cytochrome b561
MTHHDDVANKTRDRYTRVAIVLHWAIAAFILCNLGIGLVMEDLPRPLYGLALMLHASSGLTVLVLTAARVVWRLINSPPPHPAGMKPWERHAAHFAHFFLYAAMVLMPLTGWSILSSHAPPGSPGSVAEFATPPPGMLAAAGLPPGAMPAGPIKPPPPLRFWGAVTMPMIGPIQAIAQEPAGVAPQRVLHDHFVKWHSVGAFLLIGVLILHILGALKHQFIDKQAEFARMRFGGKRPGR